MNLWKKIIMIFVIGFGVNAISVEVEIEEWSSDALKKAILIVVQGINQGIPIMIQEIVNQGMPNVYQLQKLAIEKEFDSVSKVSNLTFDFVSQDSPVVRFTVETVKGEVFENCTCNVVEGSSGIFLEECQSPEVVFDKKVFIPQSEFEEALSADAEFLKSQPAE